MACGYDFYGQCSLPILKAGLTYTQVTAGSTHTGLLRSDGTAVACGFNQDGQCIIPACPEGLSYTNVAAGGYHTIVLRSDGAALAFGQVFYRQCAIPDLPEGLTYIQAAGGALHSALLRSDGTAVGCGGMVDGQCDLPPLEGGLTYTSTLGRKLVLQASFAGTSLQLMTMDGQELGRIDAIATDGLSDVYARDQQMLQTMLAGGRGGTVFHPHPQPLGHRKSWLAHALQPQGSLQIDGGACKALCDKGASLLLVGITDLAGEFQANQPVLILDQDGREVARALSSLIYNQG